MYLYIYIYLFIYLSFKSNWLIDLGIKKEFNYTEFDVPSSLHAISQPTLLVNNNSNSSKNNTLITKHFQVNNNNNNRSNINNHNINDKSNNNNISNIEFSNYNNIINNNNNNNSKEFCGEKITNLETVARDANFIAHQPSTLHRSQSHNILATSNWNNKSSISSSLSSSSNCKEIKRSYAASSNIPAIRSGMTKSISTLSNITN
jgi:hypothetical protein